MTITSTIKLRGRGATTGQSPSSLVAGEIAINEVDQKIFHRSAAGAVNHQLICGLKQNRQSGNYTCVMDDAGGHIYHPSADTTARNWTIPANSSVPYKIGTTLTFVNQNGAGTISILITDDTMRLAGSGATGTRTLVANGFATAIKVETNEWLISGRGLT